MVLHQHLSEDKKSVEFGRWSGSCGNEYWEVYFRVPVIIASSHPASEPSSVFVDNGQLGGGNCIGEVRKNVFYPLCDILKD